MNDWHYEKGGKRFDQVSDQQMSQLIRSGALNANTLVWKKGMADWARLAESELAGELLQRDQPPPLPGSKVPSAYIWLLAFAPILGFMLESFITAALGMDDQASLEALDKGQFWYVTVLLNIVLGFLDERRLRRCGFNTEGFGSMCWLVPVYLWKRAKNIKTSTIPFWIWLATFAFILMGRT
ncbi:hypothetical protein TUM12370_10560 [Salmonella enterica subsp. enterica serovar Choleraesuis]|nr:hypothetical protein TUM12370_10560 [Salmonella enterica subsp. enterica serovar Choleraesuis]